MGRKGLRISSVFLFVILALNLVSAATCTDSDNGVNYYVKGQVVISENGTSLSYNDACVYKLEETNAENYVNLNGVLYNNMAECSGDNCYVAEAFCENNAKKWTVKTCLNGCSNGVCLCPTTRCSDGAVYGPEKCTVKENVCECPSCPAVPETCKNEGGVIGWQDSSSQCCGGLAKITVSSAYSSDCSAITANASSTCTNCGNTLCGLGESKCNCPYDCKTDSSVTATPVCQSTKCSDGSVYECKIINGICSCPSCPAPLVKSATFSISGVEGVKKSYFPSETLNLIMKGVEQDGTPATAEEGFNIQFYIDKWPLVQEQGSKGDNAYYKEGYWYGSISVPDKLAGYRLRLFLYCSRDNSICSKTYGIKGAQVENTYYFSIINGEKVSEQVICGFKNSDREQKCYAAEQNSRASCSGIGNCTANIPGYKSEQITWKSSCGGYKSTIQDGNNEKIEFDCRAGETTATEIKNKGFRFAYWQCYDGSESRSEDSTSCKTSETWQKYAAEFCNGKCITVGQGKCKGNEKCEQKCGVNSFSLWNECYWEETAVSIPATSAPTAVAVEPQLATSEPILVCKDSCPLDGKCYPFGYRKSGKYCSDAGGFTEQSEGSKVCDNNFECSSNVCVSGKCVSEGFIQKIMNWFSKLFGG